MQYIQTFDKTFTAEIFDSRDQKILASEMSVAMDQRQHGNSIEKVSDLDLS